MAFKNSDGLAYSNSLPDNTCLSLLGFRTHVNWKILVGFNLKSSSDLLTEGRVVEMPEYCTQNGKHDVWKTKLDATKNMLNSASVNGNELFRIVKQMDRS